jgi:hypothetical protein
MTEEKDETKEVAEEAVDEEEEVVEEAPVEEAEPQWTTKYNPKTGIYEKVTL